VTRFRRKIAAVYNEVKNKGKREGKPSTDRLPRGGKRERPFKVLRLRVVAESARKT